METFKQIFPKWTDFKQYLIDFSFYYQSDLYSNERVLMYYTLLYRNFANSHTAFDIEIFYEMLSITIAENFREFFIVRALLDEVANTAVKDLLIGIESINNVAENPNIVTDKNSVVNYIGSQARGISRENIVDRVYTLIPKIHIKEIQTEVKKYSHLFLKIIPKTFWLYEEDENV